MPARAAESFRSLPGILCLLSLSLLSLALMQDFGDLTRLALTFVLLALAMLLAALVTSRRARWEPSRRWWVAAVLIAGLSNLLNLGLPQWIGIHWSTPRDLAVILLIAALTAAAVTTVTVPRARAPAAVTATAAVAVGLLVATWPSWGSADIDVFHAVTGATGALLHGGNPYGPVFHFVTVPGPSTPGSFTAHFPYGPIVPAVVTPGWLVGDVRAMSVVAVMATAAGLGVIARQGPQAGSAHRVVALALASPLAVAMVQEAWVEVYIVTGIVWWLALRRSHPRWAIVPLAAAMLVNPITLVVLVPPFLWSHRARMQILVAALAAALATLPSALVTGGGALLHDLIGVQVDLPPRYDALTVTSYVWQTWHLALPSWLPAILVAAAVGLIVVVGRPESEAQLIGLAAVMIFVTFLAAKWAYFNYYYIAAMLLLAAMASAGARLPAGDVSLPDPLAAPRWLAARFGRARAPAGPTVT